MIENSMQKLVQRMADHLEDRLGAPQSLHCNDEIIMIDADDLQGLPAFRKRRILARAKQETVRRLMTARIGRDADTYDVDGARVDLGDLESDARDRVVSQEIDSIVDAAEHVRALRARRGLEHLDCFEADVRGHCTRIRHEIWGRAARATEPRSIPATQPKSIVYLVTCWRDDEVKIGYTTRLPHRLRSFRTACPRDPKVLLKIDAGRELERHLHARFADDRIRPDREWFRLSPAIAAFIAAEKAKQASN